MKRFIKYVGIGFLLLLVVLFITYFIKVRISPPRDLSQLEKMEVKQSDSAFVIDQNNWLLKNKYGLWEMGLSGSPEHIGQSFGALAQASGLFEKRERAFVKEIENRMPSSGYLSFIKYLVGWFNRDLEHYVKEEYQREIFASSQYMSDDYDYIAPKYHRGLNYHAAHDIGHALQNMNLVGCTSFGVWGDRTEDEEMIIGRNFDFYFGQEFAHDKVVAMVRPDSGYSFVSVTWMCFSGVVSGMNEKGLTVTLNAAKSEIPTKAKSPVSLIAREVLQYASNIQEAYDIIEKHESFVAETFLIGSKKDRAIELIEKSPELTAIYRSPTKRLVATNHFQSEELFDSDPNQEYISQGVSDYRLVHVNEILDSLGPINAIDAVEILRDQNGIGGEFIGFGNEKAINQLIAHHGVIFAPYSGQMWVSAEPYVLGEFVAYDLDDLFKEQEVDITMTSFAVDSLTIPKDSFYFEEDFENYQSFLSIKEKLVRILYVDDSERLSDREKDLFVTLNKESYQPYYYFGQYHMLLEEWGEARQLFEEGLTKVVSKRSEVEHMELLLDKANKKLEND